LLEYSRFKGFNSAEGIAKADIAAINIGLFLGGAKYCSIIFDK